MYLLCSRKYFNKIIAAREEAPQFLLSMASQKGAAAPTFFLYCFTFDQFHFSMIWYWVTSFGFGIRAIKAKQKFANLHQSFVILIDFMASFLHHRQLCFTRRSQTLDGSSSCEDREVERFTLMTQFEACKRLRAFNGLRRRFKRIFKMPFSIALSSSRQWTVMHMPLIFLSSSLHSVNSSWKVASNSINPEFRLRSVADEERAIVPCNHNVMARRAGIHCAP